MSRTAFEKLSDKHKMFVTEVLADFNQTRAAKECGFNCPQVAGAKLMARKNIREALKELTGPILQDNLLTVDRVVKQLETFLFLDPAEFWDERGKFIGNIRDLPLAVRQCIQGFKVTRRTFRSSDDSEETEEEIEVKIPDRVRCLELAMKYLKLLGADTNLNAGSLTLNFNWDAFYKQQTADGGVVVDQVSVKMKELEKQ